MSEPDRQEPPTLDYRPTEYRVTRPEAVVGYAFATALFIVGGVALTIFVLFAMNYKGEVQWTPAEARAARISTGCAVALGVVSFVGLNWIAYRCYRRPDRRAIALGIWIGIGVAALIEGACFSRAL